MTVTFIKVNSLYIFINTALIIINLLQFSLLIGHTGNCLLYYLYLNVGFSFLYKTILWLYSCTSCSGVAKFYFIFMYCVVNIKKKSPGFML